MGSPREFPILFSAEMVRAILDGRKTQTRRLLKLSSEVAGITSAHVDPGGTLLGPGPYLKVYVGDVMTRVHPRWRVGDRLWVKETWQAIHVSIDPETGLGDEVEEADRIPKDNERGWWGVAYAATDPQADDHIEDRGFSWRPSIYMPRWASRITLEVTDVRIQRVQDISEEDAFAEGVKRYDCIGAGQRVPGPGFGGVLLADQPHRLPFADLWRKLNGEESWDSNPWVTATTFKRVEVDRG